jgi:predicted N-formylglutamate amidohydrolase
MNLLDQHDVTPVHEYNSGGASPFLLVCDHYGRRIPRSLGDLGLAESELIRHIAWDIGIAGVAEALSDRLGAHLIAQRYSRLVIDCNRSPAAASSIPPISETTIIPGNRDIGSEAAEARRRSIFEPYHRRIAEVIEARVRQHVPTVLVSLHSFTPVYGGEAGLVVGDNEPYAVREGTDYTIPVHGEQRGLLTSGIEIRQDLIAERAGQQRWAERLSRALAEIEQTLRAQRLL